MHVSPPYAPSDMVTLLDEMDAFHAALSDRTIADQWRPKIVFEPTPPCCMPEQRLWLEQCLRRIHILS